MEQENENEHQEIWLLLQIQGSFEQVKRVWGWICGRFRADPKTKYIYGRFYELGALIAGVLILIALQFAKGDHNFENHPCTVAYLQ